MIEEKMTPIHPGEVLKEDFIDPMGITQYRLAKDIGAHPRRINAKLSMASVVSRPTQPCALAAISGSSPSFG